MTRFPIPILLLACCAPSHSVMPVHASTSFTYRNTVDMGDVEPSNLIPAFERFKSLAEAGEKEITLRIDSMGGNILFGFRWIRDLEDVKKAHGLTVACVVDGSAYSMAAVILQSPLCDVRLATFRSTFLFHNGSRLASGNAEEIKNKISFLEALNEAMALVVSGRMGMGLDHYRSRIAHGDWALAIREALELNVIDGVVMPSEIAPPL